MCENRVQDYSRDCAFMLKNAAGESASSAAFLFCEISDELQTPEIVEMNDTEDAARVVHDDNAGDAAFFH